MTETARLEVDLPQFHGPLDLLLHLIQKNEMDIHDIAIAEITDQYLAYIDLMQMLDLDVASEYLVMASTLLYLKSQSMLPTAKPTRSGEHPAEMREQLVRQLLEYKRFKEAARFLDRCESARAEVFTRPPDQTFASRATREYTIHADLFDLLAAFQTVISHHAEVVPDFSDEIEEDPITVEGKMREILSELERGERIAFGDFFSRFQTKLELIVTFLAILELTRLGQAFAIQEELFGPIYLELNPDRPDISSIEWTSYDEPRELETDY